MMNIKSAMKKLLFSLLVLFSFMSCNVDVNGKFESELGSYISTKFTYYKDRNKEPQNFIEKYYVIGRKLTAADLPDQTDSAVWNMKPGYNVTGWSVINSDDLDSSSYTTNHYTGTVETITVTGKSVKLDATWQPKTDTPYKLVFKKQDLKADKSGAADTYTIFETKDRQGTTDTTIEVAIRDLVDLAGFTTPVYGLTSYKINGDGSTQVELLYDRETYTFTFYTTTPVKDSGCYEQLVTQNIAAPTKSGYSFYGWTEGTDEIIVSTEAEAENKCVTIPQTFTEDKDYAPVWGPIVYYVEFKDQFGKSLTAGPAGLALSNGKYRWDDAADLSFIAPPIPVNDGAAVEFAGWYKDSDCTETNKITETGDTYTVSRSDMTGDQTTLTLYAKWKYNKIYVNPGNGNGTIQLGNDTNNGMTTKTPLKSMKEAKKYSYEQIVILNALTEKDDIQELTDLETKVSRYTAGTQYTYPFINYSGSEEVSIGNVTLDGGAVWVENTNGSYQLGEKKYAIAGKSSSAALIVNSGKLKLLEGIILQNNNYTGNGGAIHNTGDLEISGNSLKSVLVRNNKSAAGGAIYTTNNMNLTYANFSNNYSASQGGAIYIENKSTTESLQFTFSNCTFEANTSVNAGGTLYSICAGEASKATTSKNVITLSDSSVKANRSMNQSGGGFYLFNATLNATDTTFDSNIAKKQGGAITVPNGGEAVFTSCEIFSNSAESGGGLACTGTGTRTTLGAGTTVYDNTCSSTGPGAYVTGGYLIFNGGYVNTSNLIYATGGSTSYANIRLNSGYLNGILPENNNVLGKIQFSDYITDKSKVANVTEYSNSVSYEGLFLVQDSPDGKKWKINSTGYLECLSASGGGTIINPLDRVISCSVTKTSDTTYTYFKIGIKAKFNSEATESLDVTQYCTYTATLYYMGAETTYNCTRTSSSDVSDTIKIENTYPSGEYQIYISGFYLGTPISQWITVAK